MNGRINNETMFAIAESDPMWECTQCGKRFKVMGNVGKYRCRFHRLGYSRAENCYPCCYQPNGTVGCMKSDHTDTMFFTWDDEANTVFLDKEIAQKLFDLFESIPQSSFVEKGKAMCVSRIPR